MALTVRRIRRDEGGQHAASSHRTHGERQIRICERRRTPRVEVRPSGNEATEVWATHGIPTIPVAPNDPTVSVLDFFPVAGDTSFKVMRMSLGLESGMHTSDTVDCGIVVSGEMWLELDDGAEVHLKQGDCVVQNGTRHNWRNRGSEVCVMAFVLIGAKRS